MFVFLHAAYWTHPNHMGLVCSSASFNIGCIGFIYMHSIIGYGSSHLILWWCVLQWFRFHAVFSPENFQRSGAIVFFFCYFVSGFHWLLLLKSAKNLLWVLNCSMTMVYVRSVVVNKFPFFAVVAVISYANVSWMNKGVFGFANRFSLLLSIISWSHGCMTRWICDHSCCTVKCSKPNEGRLKKVEHIRHGLKQNESNHGWVASFRVNQRKRFEIIECEKEGEWVREVSVARGKSD